MESAGTGWVAESISISSSARWISTPAMVREALAFDFETAAGEKAVPGQPLFDKGQGLTFAGASAHPPPRVLFDLGQVRQDVQQVGAGNEIEGVGYRETAAAGVPGECGFGLQRRGHFH